MMVDREECMNPENKSYHHEGCPYNEECAVRVGEVGMMHNVPVQSLIDHIKTAIDVDPWAKEMVEELLKEQDAVVRCKDCKYWSAERINDYNKCKRWINVGVKNFATMGDWFCADGERRNNG